MTDQPISTTDSTMTGPDDEGEPTLEFVQLNEERFEQRWLGQHPYILVEVRGEAMVVQTGGGFPMGAEGWDALAEGFLFMGQDMSEDTENRAALQAKLEAAQADGDDEG